MIEVKFQAADKASLYKDMLQFLGVDQMAAQARVKLEPEVKAETPKAVKIEATSEEMAETPKAEVKKEAKPKKRKPGRPKAADVPPPISKFTKTEVSAALQKVNIAKGLATCKGLLEDFDAKKLGDIKEEKYESFVDACDAVLL